MTISITYSTADSGKHDLKGRRLALVTETYEGIDLEPQTFSMPGTVVESFIRARRAIAERRLKEKGYSKNEPIDWSFLRKDTKK